MPYLAVHVPPPLGAALIGRLSAAHTQARKKIEWWVDGLIFDYFDRRCSGRVLKERVRLALERGAWGRALSERECAEFRRRAHNATEDEDDRPPVRSRNPLPRRVTKLILASVNHGLTNTAIAQLITEATGLPISPTQVRRLRAAQHAK